MRQLLNFEYNFTSSDISELISCIPERLLVSVWGSFFDVQVKLIEGLLCLLRIAHMAFRSVCFTLSTALITSGLELLNETWPKSLRFQHNTLAFTFSACFNVIWVVSSRTPTMRTNC
jgi:uncharacterized membrane protein YccF (DUF307 family)